MEKVEFMVDDGWWLVLIADGCVMDARSDS
jgi:hypothetical protein